MSQPFPNTWHQIKTRLEKETAAGKHWLSYGTFQLICGEAEEKDQTNQKTLITYLNDLGTICFFDDPELAHLQILNPQWLLSGVYKLLTSPITAQRFGDIEVSDFPKILTAVDTDDFHYDRAHYPYLVALMKKFELCYVKDRQLLIPAAFAFETKGEYAEFRQQASAHYFIQYQHRPPTSIIHRFIARLLPWAEDNDYWSTGIRLHDDELQARAFVQLNRQERCIDFWIIAKNPLFYWLKLRDHIREINSFFAHIECQERVMVGQRKSESVDFHALLAAKVKGGLEYFVPFLQRKLPVDASLATLASEKEIETRVKAELFDQACRGDFSLIPSNVNLSPQFSNIVQVQAEAKNEVRIVVELDCSLDDLTGAINRALRAKNDEALQEQAVLLKEALSAIDAIRENPDKRAVRTGGYIDSFQGLVNNLLNIERLTDVGKRLVERLQSVIAYFSP